MISDLKVQSQIIPRSILKKEEDGARHYTQCGTASCSPFGFLLSRCLVFDPSLVVLSCADMVCRILQSLREAATPRPPGTPRVAKADNPCPTKTFAVGYGGFVPGTYVLHNSPERYLPKTTTPMDKAIGTPGTMYLGDLTQEWNIGHPYKTSQESYGEWSPLSLVTEGKPKLWTHRK